MKTVIFATGNKRKVAEAENMLEPFGIAVESRSIDIDEIQHHDPAEITKAKARAAFAAIRQPVVVNDSSWSIPVLGGFPGGYMKDICEWLSPEDWMKIMAGRDDRTIYLHEHVAYFDGESLQHFETTYEGYFADKPSSKPGNSIEKTICLYGDKTLAEGYAEKGIASNGTELGHWKQFGEWFTKRDNG